MRQESGAGGECAAYPVRFWWLKRLVWGAAGLALLLAGARWWIGYDAERRLEGKIAEYRAAGEPILVEDFERPRIADGDNAGYFLEQAFKALQRPSGEEIGYRDLCQELDLVRGHMDDAALIIEENRAVLELVREGLAREGVDWKQNLVSPVCVMTYPYLSGQREVAKFLCTAALYEQARGNEAESLRLVRDAVRHSYVIAGEFGTLINYLVTIATQALAAGVIEETTAEMRFDASTEEGAAARETARELIGMLLDDSKLSEAWRRSYYGERLQTLDMQAGVLAAVGPSIEVWFLKPVMTFDTISNVETCTCAMRAGEYDNYPTACEYFDEAWSSDYATSGRFHLLPTDILAPSMRRSIQLSFRVIAFRRMAATALALRLYEADRGERARSLEDLTPEYLAAVPVDPFARDGSPIGYLPDGASPLLYSVGMDGADDGGAYALEEDGSVDQKKLDLVHFLDGRRPRRAPED